MGQIFLLAGGLVLLTYALTGFAAQSGWMADVVTDRSNHTAPVSRAGGVTIVILVAAVMAILTLTGKAPEPPLIASLAVAAGVLGALDDVRSLPPLLKLLILGGLSVAAILAVGTVPAVPLPTGEIVRLSPWISYPLSVFFVLGFVNAFNFMDGLNGMASGPAILGCAVLVAVGGGGDGGFVVAALLTAVAVFGFAIRNVVSGSIFMGDAGSLALGFFLGTGAIGSAAVDPMAFYVFAIAFVPFLADTALTLLNRWRKGKPILEAHKEHFYQRLRAKGWSHQAVSLAYLLIMSAGAAMAYAAFRWGPVWSLWAALAVTLVIYGLVLRAMFRARGE